MAASRTPRLTDPQFARWQSHAAARFWNSNARSLTGERISAFGGLR
jgi:hypothetical protein